MLAFSRRQINEIYSVIEIHGLDTPLYLSCKIGSKSVKSMLTIHPDDTDVSFKFTLNVGHTTSAVLNLAMTPDQPSGGSVSLGF